MTLHHEDDQPLRILIVSQYFRPERVSVPTTLADELSRRGHRVEVITGWPNYPEGRLFAGYRQRLAHTEEHGDVIVRRVPLFVSHSRNSLGRLVNYASFAATSAARLASGRRADVVYVYATQMTASIGPALWRRLFGTPYVLHVQDLWPESVSGSGMVDARLSGVIDRLLAPWLRRTYARAAQVVAIAPTMLETLRARGAHAATSSVILNWSPADVVTPRAHQSPATVIDRTACTKFVYAGNLGDLQDLTVLVDAFALCSDIPDVELEIVGSGVLEDDLRTRASRYPDARITFSGRVDPAEMADINARSDFQLVTLKALDIFRGTIPSKLQNSLAAGVPVVTTVHGDVTELVEREGIGFTAQPSDVEALAAAVRRAVATTSGERRAMGDRARAFYENHMSESAGVSAMEAVLRSATRTTAKTSPTKGTNTA